MNKLTTKEDVFNLLSVSTPSIALGAAIETGLIQMLAEKPMSGEEVSCIMNIPGKRGYYWLQLLEELGIIEIDSQGYTLSSIMRNVISDSIRLDWWKYVASDERELLAGSRNLSPYIGVDSIWIAQGLAEPVKGYKKIEDDPERARVFTRLLYNFYKDAKNEFVHKIHMAGVKRMMDVGGGSGAVSILLAQKCPDLRGVVVDFENVCIEGRRIVEENHLSDRITFHGANFLKDDLPKGFDLVLHYDIGVFGEELFRKLWESLNPGGRIVVVFHFSPEENSAPTRYLGWAFRDSLNDPDFGFPTVPQLQAQLVQAGFQLLPGEYVLSEGQTAIQAQKVDE
ncbi:MAG TPA: methyltransferase [Anaerolineales bacterium]